MVTLMIFLLFVLASKGEFLYEIQTKHSAPDHLLKELSNDFYITEGLFHLTSYEICNSTEVHIGCIYNNYFTPYGFFLFPDTNDTQKYTIKGKFNNTYYVAKWRMEKNQVILFGGDLPNGLRYYSWQHYLVNRNNWGFWNFVFASLGNSVNNVRLKKSTGNFAVISTVNKVLQANLTNTIKKYYDNYEYLEFPGKLKTDFWKTKIRYGAEHSNSDTFTIMSRFALPDNTTEWEEYSKRAPIWVLKLTFKHDVDINDIHDLPVLIPEHTNFDEKVMEPEFNKLIDIVKTQKISQGYSVYKSLFSFSGLDVVNAKDGGKCLSDWFCTYCMGDIRDTIYASTLPNFNLDIDDRLFIIGVNHKLLNNTKYTGIQLYDMQDQLAINGIPDELLEGSANEWFSGSTDESLYADYFYVYEFSYNCNNRKYCTNISISNFPKTSVGNVLGIIGRDYGGVKFDKNDVILPKYLILTKNRIPYRLEFSVIKHIILGNIKIIFCTGIFLCLVCIIFIKTVRKSKRD